MRQDQKSSGRSEAKTEDCGTEIDFPGIPAKLAAPARRALAEAGIDTLAKLARTTEAEVAALHGIGRNALEQLRHALKENGLSFREK